MRNFRFALAALVATGVAFSCGGSSLDVPGGDAGSADGCTKDTDCKGDRVCQDGRCVDRSGTPQKEAGVEEASTPPIEVDAAEPDPLEGCDVVDLATVRVPVIMEIVLDGSGSMDSDNKWTAARDGLNAFFDEVAVAAAPDFALGLMIYEDTNDPSHGSGPYPTAVDVYPQPVTTSQKTVLTARLTNTTPSGGTPTYLALTGAYSLVSNYVPSNGAKLAGARKTVLLITDGVPNGGATEQTQCINATTAALALLAPKGPILTFGVGVGPFPGSQFSYDPKFIGDIAVAGGTRATPQCNPASTNINNVCHIQITPGGSVATLKAEFLKAAQRARSSATGCTLDLATGAPFDPSRVKITLKDSMGATVVLARGGSDGWEFDDDTNPTKIVFSGDSCVQMASATELQPQACAP